MELQSSTWQKVKCGRKYSDRILFSENALLLTSIYFFAISFVNDKAT